METLIYKNYLCKIIKKWYGGFYDLITIEPTEKGFREEYLSVHRTELFNEGNNI